MRHLYFIFPLLFFISCDRSDKFNITGEIENGSDLIIYLDKLDVGTHSVLDSARIRSSNIFSFSGRISEPSFYRVRIGDNNFVTLLVEPGEKIFIEAAASNLSGTYQVSGSEGSKLLKRLNDRLLSTRKQIDPLIKEIMALEEGSEMAQEEVRINEELEEIINAQRKFSVAFILDNMESLAAITALYQMIDEENYVLNRFRDIQYLKIIAESLTKKYPDSPHVKALARDAENQERQYELFRIASLAEQSGDVVSNYPDISMKGVEGDTIRLHSLPEKYVLVLFGSSLNQSSVEYTRELLPIYKAYHNKGFQIYQVSVERERQEWLRNIEFNELPWIHVAEFEDEDFRAAMLYNVQQIPSSYLINRDVGVVARNLSAPELRSRLARVLD